MVHSVTDTGRQGQTCLGELDGVKTNHVVWPRQAAGVEVVCGADSGAANPPCGDRGWRTALDERTRASGAATPETVRTGA